MGALEELNLSWNEIGDAGMIAFADAIKPTAENPIGSLLIAAENAFMPSSPMRLLDSRRSTRFRMDPMGKLSYLYLECGPLRTRYVKYTYGATIH